MNKNTNAFKLRFEAWKRGEPVYENGRVLPHFLGGKDGLDDEALYELFLSTLPDNQRMLGIQYNMRRAWELYNRPKNLLLGLINGLFSLEEDGVHASSIGYNKDTGYYEFLKANNHPTHWMELNGYNNNKLFKSDYEYKRSNSPYIPDKYVPRKKIKMLRGGSDGLNDVADGKTNVTEKPAGSIYDGGYGLPYNDGRVGVVVTGKLKKPYWVSANTKQLNYGDLEKAYDVATAGMFPNYLTAARNFVQGDVILGLRAIGLALDATHSPNGTVYGQINPGILGNFEKETEFLVNVNKGLFDAFAYKHSKQYELLANEFRDALKKRGIRPHLQIFRPVPLSQLPTIILQQKDDGLLGAYNSIKNTISIDPDQLLPTQYITVPYHEALHWQRVGHADSPLDRAYDKALTLYDGGLITKEQKNAVFHRWYESTYADDIAINDVYHDLALDALIPNADDYFIKNPQELIVHGLEAGKHVGIKPFLERPSLSEVYKAFDKAVEYDSWLLYLKDTPKNIWNILSGQFAP